MMFRERVGQERRWRRSRVKKRKEEAKNEERDWKEKTKDKGVEDERKMGLWEKKWGKEHVWKIEALFLSEVWWFLIVEGGLQDKDITPT